MNIKINGKTETVGDLSSIAALVTEKGLSADRIVVEHNHRVLARDEWAGTHVCENDTIEIVSFVGGG